jgi:hypothetical protein
METCLRKVKDNRNTLVSTLRAGGLTPASFRSEIGRMVNYEWSAMDNGAGVAPLATMMRQDELEEAEYAETIIALEQAFLDDLRREGTCRPGPCTTSRAERSNAHPPRALSSISQSKAWSINTLMRCDDSRRNRFEVRLHLSPSLLACTRAFILSREEEWLTVTFIVPSDAIDRYVPEEEGEEAVWCPICKRGQLKQSHRIMFCSYQPCGLRLDTKVHTLLSQ